VQPQRLRQRTPPRGGDDEARLVGLERLTAISRKGGRVTEVRVALQLRIDINEVRGRAQLDLNDGTKQGYTRDFEVEAQGHDKPEALGQPRRRAGRVC
jgi:hypothetical protein